MKKILSVLLAVMMIFGTFAVSASAEDWYDGKVNSDQVVVVFNFKTGTATESLAVFDSVNGFVSTDGVTGKYRMFPRSATDLKAGVTIYMPEVTPPSGSSFDCWYLPAKYTGSSQPMYIPAGKPFTIPEGAAALDEIEFEAWYKPAEAEEDTMATIMNILTKVFGAIIGILMYGGDTEAGVALMNKVLGGLL